MIIRSLKVTNFRNYDRFNITLGSKMNIFIGNNASGKTNILEAIAFLGLTKSFRNGLDCDVIKFNKKNVKKEKKAVIEGRVLNNKQIKVLKIEFLEKDKNIFVNDKKVKKYADYISNLNIIVFTPNDLDIIKGSPSIRRNLLNMTLSQISYSYLVTYNEYNKILKTRNEYLKILFTNGIADKTYLDVLTDQLVEKAVLIYQERFKYLSLINSYISDIYNIDPNIIDAYAFGEHGVDLIYAFSNTTIAKKPFFTYLKEHNLSYDEETFKDAVVKAGSNIFKVKQRTEYGIANCINFIIRNIIKETKTILCIDAPTNYNGKLIYTARPVIVLQDGYLKDADFTFDEDEKHKYERVEAKFYQVLYLN